MFNRLTIRSSHSFRNGSNLFKPITYITRLSRNISDLKYLKIPTLETRYKLFDACNAVPMQFKLLLQKLNLTLDEQIAFIALMKARGTYGRLFWNNIPAVDILRWEINTHINLNSPLELGDVQINPLTEYSLNNLEKNQELVSYAILKNYLSPEYSKIYQDIVNAPIVHLFFNLISDKELYYFLNGIMMKILCEKIAANWVKNENTDANSQKLKK